MIGVFGDMGGRNSFFFFLEERWECDECLKVDLLTFAFDFACWTYLDLVA